MSQNQQARWLVAYDIAHPRRLGRVFRLLQKHGVPVQYSVFSVDTTPMKMGTLMVQVAKLLDAKQDDVRAYRLPVNAWQLTFGAAILPEGILIG